ncbi:MULTISPECIES: pseudouridine synthase [Corallincola]|uniref:Pseudouridine synthase n=3 Tax=Corallincola TaxID=1775176 RepID=A0A368N775_9GAMM|nr:MULTISPECIES: pseudouridine synthase [Corallincola]RCU45431.1 pseudouridine synthase [Corallincola holothuriorum]TAA41059.1 pseudouridine synthase [Corallincola spongiicola]TCI02711.1 pseudouridine synthase [Corallincola luteus]
MRLDKYLSTYADLTRSQAKRALHAGEVTCNGEPIRNPGFKVSADDHISLDGMPLDPAGERYLMLHKAEQTVCSHVDDGHMSIFSLMEITRPDKLHVAGRLDADTTGLVLITDDGQWSHAITSPKRACQKRYRVWLAEALTEQACLQLQQGVMLHGEEHPTRPAVVEKVAESECLLTISEGKYHQVKRMMAAVGNKVVALHREQIGAIELDEELEPGEWRYLTPEEVASVEKRS